MLRRRLASGLAAALAATSLGFITSTAPPAAAHPGHDHDEPGTADASDPLDWNNYERTLLTKDTGEPIDLAVLPDGGVLHTARNGVVRLTEPDLGTTREVGTFDVYANSEDGLQTVGIDPDFATNNWVYVFYAPRVMSGNATNGQPYPTTTAAGSAPTMLPAGASDATYWQQWLGYNQLSRVKWNPATRSLDMSTEQVIIKVEVQRGQCCHVGGDFDFDDEGNLYLATGDNTPAGTPGANGFAPNNDAPGMNPGLDSRRGAGNTNDLRGKLLRIKVAADGSYTVPAGGLFPPGTARTRPEILAMGLRNPFRMDVDPETNSVTWGDYGPDSGVASAERGPKGLVEWQAMSIDEPINAGWPYCTGDNFNYNDWNFATATPRAFFDCGAGAANGSRWNTGLPTVPPATPATLWYGDASNEQPWPELTDFGAGSGQGPMGGPVYHYDESNPSTTKFPAYWDDKAFFGEFSQDYVAAFSLTWPEGPVTKIEDFLPNSHLETALQPLWDNPMDLEFGPDGSLYVLDYGDGFFRANPDAGLYRVDWAPGNKAPQARITATPTSSSSAPLTVQLDATGSEDPEGGALTYEWDVNGDGVVDGTGPTYTTTYTTLGSYTVILRATDPQGRTGLTSTRISVGNVAPTVTVQGPPDGGFFTWGDRIPYLITTDDPEDGDATVCSRVRWTFGLGHAEHAHPEVLGSGCTGTWNTPADAPEHGATEKLYGVVVAEYTDNGANGLPGARGETALLLNPDRIEAEHSDTLSGVQVTEDPAASALSKVTDFGPGDYLLNDPVNFTGVTGMTTRAQGVGQLAFRWGSADAAPFATVDVNSPGAMSDVTVPMTGAPTGTGRWFVTSTGGVDVDAFTIVGEGVMAPAAPYVAATTTPATPAGTNGWHTGPVTVQLAAAGPSITNVQWSTDGSTWTDIRNANGSIAPFTISAQGVTTVSYRAIGAGGTSPVRTLRVRIDSVAPQVTLTGVTDGATYGDSTVLRPNVVATDATSGLASLVATIDGAPVPEDILTAGLPLWRMSLGQHTARIVATDAAGLVTTTVVTITVTTSTDDVSALVDRFERTGLVTRRGAKQLAVRLKAVMRAEDAGRLAQAAKAMDAFARTAANRAYVPSAAAREALTRDAGFLSKQWRAAARAGRGGR